MTDVKPRRIEPTPALNLRVLNCIAARKEADRTAAHLRHTGQELGNHTIPHWPTTPPWRQRLPWYARVWLHTHGWLTRPWRAER